MSLSEFLKIDMKDSLEKFMEVPSRIAGSLVFSGERELAELGALSRKRFKPLKPEDVQQRTQTIIEDIGFDPELNVDELNYLSIARLFTRGDDARSLYWTAIHHLVWQEKEQAKIAFNRALLLEPENYEYFAEYFETEVTNNEENPPRSTL